MGRLLDNCRKGCTLNSMELGEVLAELPADATLTIAPGGSTVVVGGVQVSGPTPEAALLSAEDAEMPAKAKAKK